MKNTASLIMGAIALMSVILVGNLSGQELQSVGQGVRIQLKASDVLARNIQDIEDRKIPVEIFPPGFFEVYQALGGTPLNLLNLPELGGTNDGGGFGGDSPAILVLPHVEEYDYYVVDLGTLGGTTSKAARINKYGQITGSADISGGTVPHPFLYIGGVMSDLGTLGGTSAQGSDINDSGWIVGGSGTANNTSSPFIYSNSIMHSLENWDTRTGSASAINNAGQITGSFSTSSGYTHAFLQNGNSMQDLGTLNQDEYSFASDINSSGQVVGYSTDHRFFYFHAFLYSGNVMNDLGTLGGAPASFAYAVNDSGQVTGGSYTTNGSGNHTHVFLYSNGSMFDLDSENQNGYSSGKGINSFGQVVGYFYPTTPTGGNLDRAFLYSNGMMHDLNDLLIPNSGWTLKSANDINDNGQIVGYGINPSGQSHAFLLNPIPKGSVAVIANQPSQKIYGNYPVKQSGKDSLVVVTHGWINRFFSPFHPADPTWVNDMSNSVNSYLSTHSLNNWQVYGYKWIDTAWTFGAPDSLYNAIGEGANLGSAITIQGWSHIHLIGHSSGAKLIQTASEWIKAVSPNTIIHCTFLDPYTGNDNAGATTYGNHSDWAENYFSHDVTGDVTEQLLTHAYNVNVTQLGPKHGIIKFRSQTSGQMETCTKVFKYHEWPHEFYMNTITGNNVDSEYAGFGFPLSKEGGNWTYATNHYFANNSPAQILGTPDPSCSINVNISTPDPLQHVPNFLELPSVHSDTGSNEKWPGAVKLTPSSPSWLATVISFTNPVNSVSFDAQFSGVTGSEDMLSVYWDTNVIGTIDERIVQPGLQHYTLRFPNSEANSPHVLGLRVDPFTAAKSSVTLTNIVLSQVGVGQPFSLTTTTNTVGGLRIYELTGEAGFAYGVQASTNLFDWTDIAELINTNGTVRFFDQDSTNYPTRFYRATAP